jgi:hypothetical protein
MASGWRVVLQQELPGELAAADTGKALLYYQRQIDELAERLELLPLSRFFSRSPHDIAAYLRTQGVEPNLDDLPEEVWHDAADGLRTVRALLTALGQGPGSLPQPEKIVADLRVVERILVVAEREAIRFHLGRELPVLGEPPIA